MTSHNLRFAGGALAALLVAAALKVMLIDFGGLVPTSASSTALFQNALQQAGIYGLPLAAAAVAISEWLRLRRADIQIAIGTVVTFVVAHISTWSEPSTSHVFASGALMILALLTIGVLASLTYWTIAGRFAGWRGTEAERSAVRAADAFQRASVNANVKRCGTCVAVLAAIGAAIFAVHAWVIIDGTGLRGRLVADAESSARSALASSGFQWAKFKIVDDRGVITGQAPDELEKRAAFDAVREKIAPITGFPGIISRLENNAVARLPMASVSEKLADAARREAEAYKIAEEAKQAALEARKSEEAAKKLAAEQAAAAKAELIEQQLEEKKRLAQEAQDNQQALALANPPEPAAPSTSTPEPEGPINSAAVAPTAAEVGAMPSVPDAGSGNCTDQDLALVETSRVHFEPQTFEVDLHYQQELDRIAASLQACPQRPVQITGYSDVHGDRLFNPALGWQRAVAVRDGLVARGIAPTRIVTSTPPLDPLDADVAFEERRSFRRAEFKFVDVAELSRDATQAPDERASNCENDLSDIMSQSIIHFKLGSARVSPESLSLINKLANAVKTCGSVIVTVEGHTDKIGTLLQNQLLSEARANSVREALVAAGADPTRLASKGYAASRPFDSAETAEAYALNRRIEFKVSGKFTTTQAGGP